MSLLEVANVSKSYQAGNRFGRRHRVQAVAEASFSINDGDCLGLVGESGSGKSTLGRLVVGLERPDGGRVDFRGVPVGRLRRDKKLQSGIQMVFQDSSQAVNPIFTARSIIAEPLKNFYGLSGRALEGRIAELLEAVGLPPSEGGKLPSQFSGGQLQRICVARALAADPKLIVLDEPLRSLDVSVQAQIINLLEDLRARLGVSYLLISHDLEAVYNLATGLAVMFAGRVVEAIDDISFFGQLKHPYSKALMAAADFCLADSPCPEAEAGFAPGGCAYSTRCPVASKDCLASVPETTVLSPGHRLACFHCG
ncbi:MAG: ABC transporter ATP-binding protein [Deltaproteobacteria bacterium]|jgi:oligopeptide/dipeptide ABC transporter ATP-binding protein|nr:ABC transporter ATP-binding protein [Deltaproteobacteria bacterium]